MTGTHLYCPKQLQGNIFYRINEMVK